MKLKVIALMLLLSLALCFAVSCTEDQIVPSSTSSAVSEEEELPPGYQSMAQAPTPSRDESLTC